MQAVWQVPTESGETFTLQASEGDVTLVPGEPPLSVKVIYREDVHKHFEINHTNQGASTEFQLHRITGASRWRRGRLAIEVSIPQGVSVDIRTGGGHLSANGLQSHAKLTTRGGDVTVDDFQGGITIHTEGGKISLANGNGDATVSSLGGDIIIKSHVGRCVTRTDGGAIRISGLHGDLEASASAGEIHIQDAVGHVVAKGHAGVLDVALAPGIDHGGRLELGTGKIRVLVPRGANLCLDAGIESGMMESTLQVAQCDDEAMSRWKGDVGDGGSLLLVRLGVGVVNLQEAT